MPGLAPRDKVLPVRQIGALRVGGVGLSGELERLEYLGVHEVAERVVVQDGCS